MNSIYELMNKIDDNESLNEKYNVRTLKDVKKLQESAKTPSDRSSIKTRVNELIDMVDWSKWKKFTSTGDDTKPEVKRTKAIDDGIRVDVYLGWDYGHNDDMKEYVKAVKEKFDAFAAVVRKEEPSWSVKLVKSYGSRGVTWTNYWAQVTAKNSIKESVDTDNNMRKLHESTEHSDAWKAAYSKLNRAAEEARLHMDPDFVEYALEDDGAYVEDVIENEVTYVGDVLKKEFPNLAYWKFLQDERFSSAIQVYSRPKNSRRFSDVTFEGNYELAHDRLYPIDVE